MSQDARRDEELNTARRARILGLQYIDTAANDNKQLFKELLTSEELQSLRVIPILADAHAITFGVTNTTSQQTMKSLRERFGDQRIVFGLISEAGFREYMNLYNPPKEVVYQEIALNQAGNQELIASVSATLDQVRADDMLAYLVQQAHRLNASDIHLETGNQGTRIRFRIDGVLHPIATLTPEKYRILVSVIASAGNISTSAADPQQGHISQKVTLADNTAVDINLRLETAPTISGLDIVLRLFNMDQAMYNLDRLGLSQQERAVVDDIIAKPTGLVLVVGPTGSGKTTTLYSMLNSLNTDARKIITIEDPVEYQFAGISQISVTSKGTQETNFAERLRAVLRLDPDIVMVGEIRDLDTAKTALQAALTGHLVLSTFHASSAAAALTRLEDVIGQNPLYVSAIRLVMAQRLVRRLVDETKQPYQPDEATIKQIKAVIDELPDGIEKPSLENLTLYKPGSTPDNPFGYQGQIALREQFTMTDTLRDALSDTSHSLTTQRVEAAASQSGMRTMMQDAMLKVVAGETTLDEVFRVLG